MEDALSFLDGRALAEEPVMLPPPQPLDPWWEKFRYDLYDWNDPEFKLQNQGESAYKPVLLSQGFFMMVSSEHYEEMTLYPNGKPKVWSVKLGRDEESNITYAYACRRGKGEEPAVVYAHREILRILFNKKKDGDHINGWGLDNRGVPNLRAVSSRINQSNTVRRRKVHFGLPAGVELRGKDEQGRQLYGGTRRVRVSKTKVTAIRSKEQWTDPRRAAEWYQDELKRIFKCAEWAHNPPTLNWPLFPPLLESEPAARVPQHEQYAEIPFL